MRRRALPLIAGLVTFITIVSGGVAYALWSVSAEQTISASAAEMGITMVGTSAEEGLALGYNEGDDRFANAGAITITNDGTRDAWYSATVTVTEQSVAGLRNVIRLGGYVVADVADCLPTSAPGATLASGSATITSDSLSPTQLEPGQSVVLCLETWLPEADISAFGNTHLDLEISSALRYTAYPDSGVQQTWTTDAQTVVTVRQDVVTEDLALLFENPIGRYWVSNTYYDEGTQQLTSLGTVCKAGGNEQPARHDGVIGPCTGDNWNSQWRLVPVPNEPNVWWILRAVNSYTQPNVPRWTITDLSSPIVNVAPDNDDPDQKWIIEGRGDGTYRIKAATRTDGSGNPICIAIGAPLWGGVTSLVPAACSGVAVAQGFRFDLIGYPVPGTRLDGNGAKLYPNGYPLVCGGSEWSRSLSWMASTSYEAEVHYRIRAIEHGGTTIATHDNGYSTAINIAPSLASLEAWYQAHGGGGATTGFTIVVEQQITELGQWAPITIPAPVWIQHVGTNDNRLHCGTAPGSTPTPTPSATPTPTATPTTPPGPIAFPSSWCTPESGNYLHIHFPYANGSTWRVFFWKTGQPEIDPNGSTSRIDLSNSWHSGTEQYLELRENGQNSMRKWAQDNGGSPQSGVEVRLYRDLGGGSWEYYAVRSMTFSNSKPYATCL